jgi:hypothetical protein
LAWNLNLMGSSAFSGIPMFREVYSTMSGFGGEDATARALGDLGRGVVAVKNIASSAFTEEDTNWYAATRSLITAGNVLSPVKYPAGQINQIIRGMEKSSENEAVLADYLIYQKDK